MDSSNHNMFTIEFEAGVLSLVGERPVAPPASRHRIGWFLQSLDVNGASQRYRSFHFARVLDPQFESRYFNSAAELQESLPNLDAIVIVKRLDRAVLELVGAAKLFDVPVFLDLCDDLMASSYGKNEFGVNLLHFFGIAPLLAGVTVPTAEMADRIEFYARDHHLPSFPVHVVPDIAETWEIYRATFKHVTGSDVPAVLDEPRSVGLGPKRVVWFGNYGASHSNFGIFTVKPFLKALKAVNENIPLELIIVSNSESVFRALVYDCGFSTRYVPWSAQAVYSELVVADAALLTTGDDEFCAIKSSNRVLQALAMNVPVITSKGASIAEFEDAIFSGRLEDSLRLCLGPARARVVPARMETARRVLERYTPERLSGIWASLLKTAIEKRREGQRAKPPRKFLVVLEPGDSPAIAKKLFSAARKLPNVETEVLLSTELLDKQPEFAPVVGRAPTIPRFFSGKLNGPRNLLLDCSALVVERPEAPLAKQLSALASPLGVPVVSSGDAVNGGLDKFIPRANLSSRPSSGIRAGPYAERLNTDGILDWAFVVHENARGWILDAICREIGSRQPDSWHVCYYPEPSPDAKNYFFSHYLLLQNYLDRHPEKLRNSNLFVWYTHPREENPVSVAKLLLAFDKVTKVVFACESNRRIWLERGLPEEKTAVILGAADPALFRSHERGSGVVGLSSAFYERKNPDRLLEVIKLLPHRRFSLLGKNWNRYALFEEMKTLPNFTYKSAPYRDYPEIYSKFDVFLSMSNLEGGPIPLIEAMMSNAVPVASRTGFAPDLIRHGENGFIFDVDASATVIAKLIEAAFALPGDVRHTVEQYDWDNFSTAIVKLAG
jgi:glycosyltransferase involved in cell wall biosynthesis